MSKTIYLHIGNFKTGTSAIQKFCNDFSQRLENHGVKYLSQSRPVNNYTNHGRLSLSLYEKFGGTPPRDWYNDDVDYDNEIKACLDEIENSSEEKILISSEEFWRLSSLDQGQMAIHELCDAFSSYQLKVIIYVREPFSFAKSWYNQVIKGGVPVKPYLDFLLSTPKTFLLPSEQLKAWETIIDKENFIIKEYSKSGSDHINEFLEILGLEKICRDEDLQKTVNRSIPNRMLEVRRLENILAASRDKTEDIQQLYKSKVLGDADEWQECLDYTSLLSSEYSTFMNQYIPESTPQVTDIFDHIAHQNDVNSLNLKDFISRNYHVQSMKNLFDHKSLIN